MLTFEPRDAVPRPRPRPETQCPGLGLGPRRSAQAWAQALGRAQNSENRAQGEVTPSFFREELCT